MTIIIVNWNTRELLHDCLSSLEPACPGLDFEVIVVDNNSSDGSAEMVSTHFPHFKLIKSGANLGFSKGNNLAFPEATGRYILLLNPDTVATPAAFRKLIQFADTKENLAAVSPLLTDERDNPTITYGFFPSTRFHWLGFIDPLRWLSFSSLGKRVVQVPSRDQASAKVDYVAGACFLMPREALEAIGYLDERFFMYFEETDWCWRAQAEGKEIWYCADVEIAHLEGRAAALASLFSIRQLQKSYRQFVAKNYGKDQVWKFRLAQYAEYSLKAVLRSLALGNREENQALAGVFRERARLQLMGEIKVEPPA